MAIILRAKDIEGLWKLLPGETRTPETYRVAQHLFLSRNPAAVAPFEVDKLRQALIGGGIWRIECSKCNESPHTDPEWGISCCFGCGAIHTNIHFPDNYRAIEELLVKRPVQYQRNWSSSETFADLVKEQVEAGDPT